jgi:hypothetical protein
MATKTTKSDNQPKALETMISIAALALEHRGGPPRLADIVRTVGQASRCLRIKDLDERLSTENAATMEIAKKLSVIS